MNMTIAVMFGLKVELYTVYMGEDTYMNIVKSSKRKEGRKEERNEENKRAKKDSKRHSVWC